MDAKRNVRLYTRTRSGKEIEIRKWPRPRDSRSPDSNDFTLSPRRRRLVPTAERIEDAIKIGVPCRGGKRKGKRKEKREYEAQESRSCAMQFVTWNVSVGWSQVLLCARHRTGIIIYMAAPDNLHKSAVTLRKTVGAIKRMFARELRTCHRAI